MSRRRSEDEYTQRRRSEHRYMRRLYGHLLCKMWVGEEGWCSIHPEIGTILVLLLTFMLMLGGCDAVRGDLIVEVQECGYVVSPDTGWYTVEIGKDLAGFGNPLGWISFAQIAEDGGIAMMSTGSYSDRYGTGDGEQQIKVQTSYLRGWDQAVLLPYGTPIGQGDTYSDFLRIYDSQTDLPMNSPLYVPFVWSSLTGTSPEGMFSRLFRGSGYVAIDQIHETPIPGVGTVPNYRIERVVLTSGDLYAGQDFLINPVPEPGVWVVVVGVCFMAWRRTRR